MRRDDLVAVVDERVDRVPEHAPIVWPRFEQLLDVPRPEVDDTKTELLLQRRRGQHSGGFYVSDVVLDLGRAELADNPLVGQVDEGTRHMDVRRTEAGRINPRWRRCVVEIDERRAEARIDEPVWKELPNAVRDERVAVQSGYRPEASKIEGADPRRHERRAERRRIAQSDHREAPDEQADPRCAECSRMQCRGVDRGVDDDLSLVPNDRAAIARHVRADRVRLCIQAVHAERRTVPSQWSDERRGAAADQRIPSCRPFPTRLKPDRAVELSAHTCASRSARDASPCGHVAFKYWEMRQKEA